MELQEEPDSRVLPRVGFFRSKAGHVGYARVVFFMCDGRKLLYKVNDVFRSLTLCCIVSKRWKGVNFNRYFYLKNRGVNFCLSMSA